MVLVGWTVALTENIDPQNDRSQYAYGENVGWLNAEPLGDGRSGVHVDDFELSGWMWGENIGWISLSCADTASCSTVEYGVENNGGGVLSGIAWGENIGWVYWSSDIGHHPAFVQPPLSQCIRISENPESEKVLDIALTRDSPDSETLRPPAVNHHGLHLHPKRDAQRVRTGHKLPPPGLCAGRADSGERRERPMSLFVNRLTARDMRKNEVGSPTYPENEQRKQRPVL